MFRFRADRTRAQIVLTLVVLTFVGCRRTSQAASLDDAARRFVRLAVALGERDTDSLDFYAGPAELVADDKRNPPPLAAITRDAAILSADLSRESSGSNATDSDRLRTMLADLAAIQARIDLLTGARLPYRTESIRFFGVAPEPVDSRRMDETRSSVAALVGRGGRLVDKFAAFSKRFMVARERLSSVLDAALQACRQQTLAHLTLPQDEGVAIAFVDDRPWSAFSRYLGNHQTVIQVNTDYQFTVDQLLQLACHEGYPGHHTRSVLMASVPDAARGWPERWIQLTFSPGSLVSEASAMAAVDVAFSLEERARIEREQLLPLAHLDAHEVERHVAVERLVGQLQVIQEDVARRYIDGELEFARAVNELEELALVPHAEVVIKYVNQYRSYVTTYTTGHTVFAGRMAACAGAQPTDAVRWQCFRELMLKPSL
jgi:hypothetical protein